MRSLRAPTGAVRMHAAILATLLTMGCASAPPPDWQTRSKDSLDRAITAYFRGNSQVERAELARARDEIRATGKPDVLARLVLRRCAAAVASLTFAPCTAFDALRQDVGANERAYADYLARELTPDVIALLPESQRTVASVAQRPNEAASALGAISDPFSRLVAAGVLFRTGNADASVIRVAIDTASTEGWRRPLLAWLHVQLRLAEKNGAADDSARIKRRIALVEGETTAP